ncbi:MAG: copper resistance protein CopB [Sphingomonas sp. 28-62-11]|nr:MAG: copper resistance protein CopB [Sphingomonas sp. 28-62-11]
MAQDHSAHQGPAQAPPVPRLAPPSTSKPAPDPHAGHAMPSAEPTTASQTEPTEPTDQSEKASDNPEAPSPGPELETPAPPEAGSGPPRAADAIWGANAMRGSRRELQQMHGDYPLSWFQADRVEIQARDGADAYLWDLQGYYGGPTSRFWYKSEGEGQFGQRVDNAEFQALYSRAVAAFFDVQAGVRQDFAGPDTTYAVLGIQGLAPYMFELDAALFVSHRGDLTARIEAELDQRITQRLIVQPRAEINLAAQDVPQLGIGAGLDSIEIGVRLRYEIVREFAPYIGVEQSWRVGRGVDFARAAGDAPRATSLVLGVRLWF